MLMITIRIHTPTSSVNTQSVKCNPSNAIMRMWNKSANRYLIEVQTLYFKHLPINSKTGPDKCSVVNTCRIVERKLIITSKMNRKAALKFLVENFQTKIIF